MADGRFSDAKLLLGRSQGDEGYVVRVAVIDSGIHPDHPHVEGVSGGVAIEGDGETDDYVDRIGHGTAVAAAIREKAPDARLFAVKVFDRVLSGSVGGLVRALDWAVDHDCHIVNMSLGTARMAHEASLRPAVERAMARGVILVAAREDAGQRWLPGCLPGVIGVMVDWNCPRDRFRMERTPAGELVCHASGYPREIPGVPPSRNLMGVSFAVANMSGLIAGMMSRCPHLRWRWPDLGELLEVESQRPNALSRMPRPFSTD